MDYVIVGGSVAAAACITAVRRNQARAKIRVVADEALPFYYRPLIPYLLDGSRSVEEIQFMEYPFTINGVEVLHDQCLSIAPEEHLITLKSGKGIRYNKLLIAAGAVPIIPNTLVGVQSTRVFTLRSLDDALAIKDCIQQGCRDVTVIGGGLVGIKAAEALLRAQCKVTVIEQKPQILPFRVDAFAATVLATRLQQQGVEIITSENSVQIMTSEGHVSGVRLASGRTIGTDLVLLAAGTKPNTVFLAQAGIKIDKAVVVNKYMQTSIPNIYAAGDLVQFIDQAGGATSVSTLWSNAVSTGKVAGYNMSGVQAAMPPLLEVMNSTEIAGLPLISAGLIDDPEGHYTVFIESHGENYRKLLFAQDRLVGLVFLGKVQRAGVYVNLIRHRIPLGSQRKALLCQVRAEMR